MKNNWCCSHICVAILMRQVRWVMRILDYGTPRGLQRSAGPTPVGTVLMRLALFASVSLLVYLFVWLVAVYFVARLVRIPF